MIDKKHCAGCRDDFYNGKNDLGVKECWSLRTATMVSALDVPASMPPPYLFRPTNRPCCYRAAGVVRVKPESLTFDGFWKSA